MFVAKVTGSVVATQKASSMVGHKLLVVEPYRLEERSRDRLVSTGRTFIAVDTLGRWRRTVCSCDARIECPSYTGNKIASDRCGCDRSDRHGQH